LGVEVDRSKALEYFEKCGAEMERWKISRASNKGD
jgi:hypothetical protein